MSAGFLKRKVVSTLVSLAVIGAFVLNGATMSYALRPQSASQDEGRINKMFGYGFERAEGINLAHDKVFKVGAANAFTEGRAVQLFGNQETSDLQQAAANYLKESGDIEATKDEVARKLNAARDFLSRVFDAEFVNQVITEIAKIDAASVKDKDALKFLTLIKGIAEIQDQNAKIAAAKKAIVDDTRFVTFIFGEKGLDPYLFTAGNILSREHRALVAHIGTFPYEGSENIAGGPRTIYATLARISGFAEHGSIGVAAYREMMLHEFSDLARGRHVDPNPDTIVSLNSINSEIDKEYANTIREVATVVTEEGSVIVSTPKVSIEKYRLETDLGKKDTFALYGSSKVHQDVPKGSPLTITIAKADVGSIGGHGTAPGQMLEAVAEIWMKMAEQGLIADFFITRVGDDISVTVTHVKGKDNSEVHKAIWDGFVHAATIAKDLGYYGAGQDLLADAFSGNVRGAGPSVAEMVIKEQGSEVLIIGQADKTAPGAFNKGLSEILLSPNTTWRPLGKGQAQKIKVGVLDFDYNKHAGRHIWFGKEDYDYAHWFLGYPDRYTIDNVTLGNGEDMAAVTAQRLGIIAGEYVGKDDPMFMIRSQSAFPAVGEITSAFLKGEYIVPGWMRGSNKGPLFPVALKDAKIGIYDGPPLLSMWSFNITNGRLRGFYDLLAANPAIRHIQDRRSAAAVRLLEEGFGAGSETTLRLSEVEIEYQQGAAMREKELSGRWEQFAPKKGAAEQEAVDEKYDAVAQKVAMNKVIETAKQAHKMLWGKLSIFADELAADIHHGLSTAALDKNISKDGKVYPILINHEALLKASPDGIMALQNLMEQLGSGKIKVVLHVNQDNLDPASMYSEVESALDKINQMNGGYTKLNRFMFAATVVGTNPEQVASQVQKEVGAGIYEVIGSEDYTKQFKGAVRVITEKAGKGQIISMAKALKLGVELIPAEGKVNKDELKKLDSLFSQDTEGNFRVAPVNVAATVENAANEYTKQVVELGTRV